MCMFKWFRCIFNIATIIQQLESIIREQEKEIYNLKDKIQYLEKRGII